MSLEIISTWTNGIADLSGLFLLSWSEQVPAEVFKWVRGDILDHPPWDYQILAGVWKNVCGQWRCILYKYGKRWQWEGAIKASGSCAPEHLMSTLLPMSGWPPGLTCTGLDRRPVEEVCAEQIATAKWLLGATACVWSLLSSFLYALAQPVHWLRALS